MKYVIVSVTGNLKDGTPRLLATPVSATSEAQAVEELKVAASKNRGKEVFLAQLTARATLPVAQVDVSPVG